MKTLHTYIGKQVVLTFLGSLGVFSFALFLGNMLKLSDLLAQGVDFYFIARFLVYLFPFLLSFSIPMSLLTSLLIIFGKLSADSELTAMRTSGIGMLRICFIPFVFAIVLSAACLYLNDTVSADTHYDFRKLKAKFLAEDAAALLKTGTFVDNFPPYLIFIAEKRGAQFSNLAIHEIKPNGAYAFIKAQRGELLPGETEGERILKMMHGSLDEPDPNHPTQSLHGNFNVYTITIAEEKAQRKLEKGTKDKHISELNQEKDLLAAQAAASAGERKKFLASRISVLNTEINKRISFALSCLAYTLIGIPLGIRTHRQEKSIGTAIALGLVAFHYMFILIAKAMEELSGLHPELIVYFPDLLLGLIGGALLWKTQRV